VRQLDSLLDLPDGRWNTDSGNIGEDDAPAEPRRSRSAQFGGVAGVSLVGTQVNPTWNTNGGGPLAELSNRRRFPRRELDSRITGSGHVGGPGYL